MISIYVPSYNSVPLIFYLESKKEIFTVITANAQIIQLCEYFNFRVLRLKLPPLPDINFFSLYKILFYKYNLQKKSRDYVRLVEGGTLYYTIIGMDLVGLEFITDIASSRKDILTIFWPENVECLKKPALSFYDIVKLKFYNWIFRPDYEYLELAGGKYLFYKAGFEEKFEIKRCDEIKTIKELTFNTYPLSSVECIDYIFVGNNSARGEYSIFNESSFEEVMAFLLDVCPSLHYKPHPGSHDVNELFKGCKILPSFIPIDLLYVTGAMFIGTNSAGMDYLARNGSKCISLIDLIDLDENFKGQRKFWKDRMELASHGNIIFVQSKEQLRNFFVEKRGGPQ